MDILSLTKETRIYNGEKNHLFNKWCWENWSTTHKRKKLEEHPTSVLLPGKSHGRRSLVGCSPWGCEESDKTEQFPFHFSLSCIGEGNGNPLQCSCLENPRDGRAWWAAIYGVVQSWTQLSDFHFTSLVFYEWRGSQTI